MSAQQDLSMAIDGGSQGSNGTLSNRVGILSKDQRRAVKRMRRGRMGRAALNSLILGGGISVISRTSVLPAPQAYTRLLALVVLSGILLTTLGRAYVLWHVIEGDLANGHVREREGYFLRQSGRRATFDIWQRRTHLTVYEPRDFQRKVLYRLYTLPRSGILVGVEARYDRS